MSGRQADGVVLLGDACFPFGECRKIVSFFAVKGLTPRQKSRPRPPFEAPPSSNVAPMLILFRRVVTFFPAGSRSLHPLRFAEAIQIRLANIFSI